MGHGHRHESDRDKTAVACHAGLTLTVQARACGLGYWLAQHSRLLVLNSLSLPCRKLGVMGQALRPSFPVVRAWTIRAAGPSGPQLPPGRPTWRPGAPVARCPPTLAARKNAHSEVTSSGALRCAPHAAIVRELAIRPLFAVILCEKPLQLPAGAVAPPATLCEVPRSHPLATVGCDCVPAARDSLTQLARASCPPRQCTRRRLRPTPAPHTRRTRHSLQPPILAPTPTCRQARRRPCSRRRAITRRPHRMASPRPRCTATRPGMHRSLATRRSPDMRRSTGTRRRRRPAMAASTRPALPARAWARGWKKTATLPPCTSAKRTGPAAATPARAAIRAPRQAPRPRLRAATLTLPRR
jgi:hypothetical protein